MLFTPANIKHFSLKGSIRPDITVLSAFQLEADSMVRLTTFIKQHPEVKKALEFVSAYLNKTSPLDSKYQHLLKVKEILKSRLYTQMRLQILRNDRYSF